MKYSFLFRLLLITIAVALFGTGAAFAQLPPDMSQGDYPGAVYLGSDYEHVDTSTGRVYLRIPLLADHSQRGDLNFSYYVSWSGMGAWSSTCYKYSNLYHCGYQPPAPWSGGGYQGPTPIMDGGLEINPSGSGNGFTQVLSSDGGGHIARELWNQSAQETTDGSGIHVTCGQPCNNYSFPVINNEGDQFSAQTVGSAYVWSVSDRNGNKMTLPSLFNGASFGPNEFYPINGGVFTSWTMTDTVGRTWSYVRAANTSNCPSNVGADLAYIWTTPGPNGGTRTFEFCYSTISISTNFPHPNWNGYVWTQYVGNWDFLSAIVLPDGTNWQFQYNDAYGDLTKLVLPTGGTITYQYTTTLDSGFSGANGPYLRNLTSRTISDGTNSNTWTYVMSNMLATQTVTDPLGNDTVYTQYVNLYSKKIQYYAGSASSGTLLKTVDMTYLQSPSGTTYCFVPTLPLSTTTTWPNGQSSSVTLAYDSGFQFVCAGSPGNSSTQSTYGSVISKTETDYGGATLRQTNSQYEWQVNPSYLSANLLAFPYQVGVTGSASVSCFFGTAQACATFAYDGIGNETSMTQSLNTGPSPVTQHGYNSYGMRTSLTDPRNNSTNYKYDSTGVCVNEIDYPTPSSGVAQIEHFTCDPNTEQVTDHQDRNGRHTQYHFDVMLRPTEVDYPDTGTTTYSYPNPKEVDVSQKITSSTYTTGSSLFDGLGREVRSIVLNGEATPYDQTDTCYDADGRAAFKSYPYQGNGLSGSPCPSSKLGDSFTFDALGRTTKVTHSDTASYIATSYSGGSTTVTDEQGKTRQSSTDGMGRLTQLIENPSGLNYTTAYTYDALDNLTGVTQASSRQRTFVYDSLSRLTSSTNPEANWAPATQTSVATTYVYDADGNLVNKTEPAQNQQSTSTVTLTSCYDALNRLTAKGYTSQTCANGFLPTPVATFVYDGGALPSGCSVGSFSYGLAIGKRTAMCDAAGSEAWSYNIVSGVGWQMTDQRTTNALTKTATYQANLLGLTTSIQYPSGRTINYAYNLGARPISATDATTSVNYANTVHYWAGGAVCSGVFGGALTSAETFNTRLQPLSMQATTGVVSVTNCGGLGQTGNLLDLSFNFSYGSGDNGNIMGITNNRDTTRSQAFTYDALNRIVTATASTYATSPAHCWGEAYQFDNQTTGGAWGNLTSIGVASTSYNGCTQESLSVTATSQNRISNGTAYGYDTAGNMTTASSANYSYDAENHLTSTAGVNYTYDGDGKRVEKSNGKLYWYGLDGSVVDETDLTGSTTNSGFDEYVFFGGKRIARRDSSNNVLYYFADHLGTSRVNAQVPSGSTTATLCYDADFYPFGGERPPYTNTCAQNYKFTGKERDTESNLDKFGARYNSSAMGRWLSPDIINLTSARLVNPANTLNKYVYGANNPLKYIDRDGEDITVFYRPSGSGATNFGHIFIAAFNQDTGRVGFLDYYPKNGTDSLGHGPGTFNTGDMQDRAAQSGQFATLTIRTTPEEAQKVLDLINKLSNGSPADYAALSNNCTTICEDVLHDLGLDFGDITPDQYWGDLYRKFSQDVQDNPFKAFPFAQVPRKTGMDYGNPRDYGMNFTRFLFNLYLNQQNPCTDTWDPKTNTLHGCQ